MRSALSTRAPSVGSPMSRATTRSWIKSSQRFSASGLLDAPSRPPEGDPAQPARASHSSQPKGPVRPICSPCSWCGHDRQADKTRRNDRISARRRRFPARLAGAHRRCLRLARAVDGGAFRLDRAVERGRARRAGTCLPAVARRGHRPHRVDARAVRAAHLVAPFGRCAPAVARRARLRAAARRAGGAVGPAALRGGVLRVGRASRPRAVAERAGPCARPRARRGAELARPPRAHLPDARTPDLPHRLGRHRRPAVPADRAARRPVGAGVVDHAVQRAARALAKLAACLFEPLATDRRGEVPPEASRTSRSRCSTGSPAACRRSTNASTSTRRNAFTTRRG